MARWFRPHELAADGPAVRYARQCLRSADCAQWAAAVDAIASFDRSKLVPTIHTPVTLIAAEFDEVASPAAMSSLAGRLPDADLHLLDGAAHMSRFSGPATLPALIIAGSRPR